MANEPDNLVLVQLREIRATQAEHSERFDQINKRLDQMDKRFEDFHALTSHTLNLSTTNYLRMREFDQRHEMSEGEQRRISERMDEFERRLRKVEEKFDC
jgi:tetrahydromethanopterin S-methyltransferase subunit G